MRSFSYSEKIIKRKLFFALVFVFAVSVLVYHIITGAFIMTYRLETNNMEPSLKSGEIVLGSLRAKAETLERGDLVFKRPHFKGSLNIFQKAINKAFSLFTAKMYLPFDEYKGSLVSGSIFRVIGLPGDTIYMKDYIAYIKPAGSENFLTEFELTKQNYNIQTIQLPNDWKSEMPFSGSTENFVLGKDEFFLLTDNRVSSLDSRLSGSCDKSQIETKIIFVLFPFKSWKSF
ncbi:MAG: signal peptidase I [Treponemataceae bacterium]